MLSLPHLSEADLRLLAQASGQFHREALKMAERYLSLPLDEMISAAREGLGTLKEQGVLSDVETSIVVEILNLNDADIDFEKCRDKIHILTNPILTSGESSAIALMICSIARDSTAHDLSSRAHDRKPNQPEPRWATRNTVADVAGGIIGGVVGLTVGGGGVTGILSGIAFGCTFGALASWAVP
jgi:hypothetical protein